MQATKGKETITFYTLPEYEAWKEGTNTRGWSIKYYKGLGTSTAKVRGGGPVVVCVWYAVTG